MLPFILGGVALAVTGYGISKFFEEDKSGYSEQSLSDVIDRFEDMKSKLYETTLRELQIALKEIENLEKDIEILIYEPLDNQYDFLTLNEKVEDKLDKYIDILEDVQGFIATEFDKFDELLMKSNNYEIYSDEEKEFVQKLIDLNNVIVKATQSKITLDGETISRDVRRAFGKIEVILK